MREGRISPSGAAGTFLSGTTGCHIGDVPALCLFVYGTLKRGQHNHDRFCQGAASIQEASTAGTLHRLPGGLLRLEVPEDAILAIGTINLEQDLLTQERINETLTGVMTVSDISHTGPKNTQPPNFTVEGELMTFPDGVARLTRLDPFEGFHPGGRSFYRRLLVPVWTQEGVMSAWVYGR